MFTSKNIHNALAIACRAMAVFIPAAALATSMNCESLFKIKAFVYFFELALLAATFVLAPTIKSYKINISLAGLCIVAIISTLINTESYAAHSISRTAFFIMSILLMSPLLTSQEFIKVRQKMFLWLCIFFIITTLVSALLYIGELCKEKHLYFAFRGLYNGSMLMSIIASLSSTLLSWGLLFHIDKKIQQQTQKRIFLALALVATLLTMLIAGSRSASCCYLLSITPILYIGYRWRKRIEWLIFTLCIVGFLGFAFSGEVYKVLKFKMDLGAAENSLTFSRDNLWPHRLAEFTEHPVFGVSIVDVDKETYLGSSEQPKLIAEKGLRPEINSEPGSSWLSLLSSLGIAGFAAFAIFNVKLIVNMKLRVKGIQDNRIEAKKWLYFSLWLSLMFYGIFEGYVLYAGANIFMFYWLLTSIMDQRGS